GEGRVDPGQGLLGAGVGRADVDDGGGLEGRRGGRRAGHHADVAGGQADGQLGGDVGAGHGHGVVVGPDHGQGGGVYGQVDGGHGLGRRAFAGVALGDLEAGGRQGVGPFPVGVGGEEGLGGQLPDLLAGYEVGP